MWRLSIAPWSRKTSPNCPEDPPKFPTLLRWRKNSSSLMSVLPVLPQQNLSLRSRFQPLLPLSTQPVDLLRCIAPGPHNGVLHLCHRHEQHRCHSTRNGEHRKSPGKQTVPQKEYNQPSAAAVKKAPQVAAPQPSPKDETPAPSESGNGEYLLPIFHFNPFGTAKAVQETHHLDLFSSNDSFFDQSLDPNGISIGTTMFPSTALPQPIDELIPSFPTITTHSCASSGSAPTCVSAKEELKWPEASWFATVGTGKYGKGQTSPNGSTTHTRPVGLTALMSSTRPQPCERSERATLRPSMTRPTCGSTSRGMISVTPRSTSWTLLKPEERNTSIYCFTSTSRKHSCRHPGNTTTMKSIERGPKRARSSSRKGSFHSKTQESTGMKPMPSSITSVKKRGTLSDSEPSATNQRKLSNSTTYSSSTS